MHWIGQVLNIVKLFNRYKPCRSIQYGWNAVYNVCTGMLYRSRLLYKEGSVRLSNNFPVTHVTIIRTINLADALGFNDRSLEGFRSYNRAHTDAVSLGDRSSQSFGI